MVGNNNGIEVSSSTDSSTQYSIKLMVGSSGVNRGIYDITKPGWIMYRDDVYTYIDDINTANIVCFPDYNHTKAIHLTVKSGTYVAPMNGWIMFQINAGWDPISITIEKTVVGATQITGNGRLVGTMGVAPIKKGDTVRITTNSTLEEANASLWFLPNRSHWITTS